MMTMRYTGKLYRCAYRCVGVGARVGKAVVAVVRRLQLTVALAKQLVASDLAARRLSKLVRLPHRTPTSTWTQTGTVCPVQWRIHTG